jgi:hypothetical protein
MIVKLDRFATRAETRTFDHDSSVRFPDWEPCDIITLEIRVHDAVDGKKVYRHAHIRHKIGDHGVVVSYGNRNRSYTSKPFYYFEEAWRFAWRKSMGVKG